MSQSTTIFSTSNSSIGTRVWGYSIIVFVCILWMPALMFQPQPWILLDYANFMIHEMGHLVFFLFPEMIMMLAGSIVQIVVPLGLAAYFFFRASLFSTGFCIFWMGDSMVNVAAYIGDARALVLPIVGGRHDWNWILRQFDVLDSDTAIAWVVYTIGRVALIAGISLMIWEVYRLVQKQQRYRVKQF